MASAGSPTTGRRCGAPKPRSAGLLVRAEFGGEPRYLIVHPSGNYNRRAPWSVPKGLVEPGESDEQAALRETLEETGLECRVVAPLGEVSYVKSRKTIVCFLAEATVPPPSPVLVPTSWENDRAEFFPAAEAREKLHPDQRPFVDRAEELA
jgi:8-oxo-dGTP pyrophosphatase MutT (NUDIX family)